MGDLRDRNDRAVRAYLLPAVKGVGGAGVPIYITNDSEDRNITDGPGLVDVTTVQGPESPLGSGNFTFTTLVRVKMPMPTAPGQDLQAKRMLMSALIGAVHDALHLTDNNQDYHATAKLITAAGNALAVDASNGANAAMVQSAANNADMVNYSALSVVHTLLGGGKESAENTNFIEVCTLQMNVAGYYGYWT